MHILGRRAGICVERLGVRPLLAVAAETIFVVGLAGNFVDGIGLVGTSCRCGAGFQGLSVKLGSFVGVGDLRASLVLFTLVLALICFQGAGYIPISLAGRLRLDGWDGKAECPRRRWSGCFE